jgi:pSer/pThr/pTyr-binding forkhead associated (FHA) protein
VLLVLGASGIAIYAYSNVLKRAGKKTVLADISGGKLLGRSGPYRQKTIVLHDGFVIGRGELCDLKLSDSTISRRHSQFRFAQGSWYIQDLSSNRGTFVNGVRINAIRLVSGDTITIGGNIFTFLSN